MSNNKKKPVGEEDGEAGHAVEAGEAEPAELDEIAGLEAEAELKRDLAKVMERKKDQIRRNQEPLFKSPSAKQGPRYLERKRYSNFIHFFDKTPEGIVCPHFHILAHANGCPYAHQYCYLNLTLRHYPEATVFSNTARMFQEIRDWLLTESKPSVLNCGGV